MNPINQNNRKTRPGFTLLEILIAMFILAIVLSTIFTSYTGTVRIVDQTEREAEMYAMARIALERMIQDLESAYFPTSKKSPESEKGPVQQAGFVGEDKEIDGRSADTLRFVSSAHLVLEEEGDGSGVAEIAYRVEENEEGGRLVLYRADTPEFEKVSEEKTDGAILCEGLFSVNFTYTDSDGEVYENWDSGEEKFKDRMPVMVSILLEFANRSHPEAPLKFMTGVALPLARDTHGKAS
jgi:general secretion pathway protein J